MLLKVGELARRTGKTVRAIRYYEELGLIETVQRTKGRFRLFDETAVGRVQLIDKFHELGFSLEEIAAIVKAYRASGCGDEAARKLAPVLERSLERLRQKIAILEGFKREIEASLDFVHDCVQCGEKPAANTCLGCQRGSHGGRIPYFIDKLL